MELLLIRHGKAEDHGHPGGDGQRALTEKGWKQARSVGIFLKKNDLVPELNLTSPLLRARETAEGVAEMSNSPEPIVQPWLACGMRPEEALQELVAYQEFQRVAIYGHEPDFSYLANSLLGSRGEGVEVKKASILWFDGVYPPRLGACLRLLLPPQFI